MLRCNAVCRYCGLLTLLALCLGFGTSAMTPPELPAPTSPDLLGARYPALSPDGKMLAFEYWGDIWLAMVDAPMPALRLTDHAAWDSLPRFSPDGAQIAFNSNRSGNTDIWVIPVHGGTARQVTTHSGNETLDAWLPDSSGVVFHSNRGQWSSDIYTVPVPAGGPANTAVETQLTASDHDALTWAQPLPGGGYIVNRGGGGRWWRKRYRGSAQNDIWRIAPPASGERWGALSPVVLFDGRDDWPLASGDPAAIYYVSDRDGIDNLWCVDSENSNADAGQSAYRQVTHHATDGVQWPSIQPGGSHIVYEFDGHIWLVDGKGGEPRQLKLTVQAEAKDNLTKRVSFSDSAGEYSVSPNGKYVVFEYMGDLWAVRDPESYGKDTPPDQDLGRALRLTPTDGARERNPAFAPDNRHVAYSSDADGGYNLYVMDLSDLSIRQVTKGEGSADHLQPEFDPQNGDYLFAFSGNRELRRYNLKDGTSNRVAEANFRGGFGYNAYDVSPDGKWVAFVNEEPDWSSEIYIASSDGQTAPVNITKDPDSDGSPQWSRDGSRLVWRSDRDTEESAFWAVELSPKQLPLTTDFFLTDEPADMPHGAGEKNTEAGKLDSGDTEADKDQPASGDSGDSKGKAKAKEKKKVEVKINFKDIQYRARRLTRQSNTGSGVLSEDGKWLIYQADPDGTAPKLWVIRADPRPEGAKSEGWEAAKVQDGGWSSPQLASEGKRIYYLESQGGGGRAGGGGGMGRGVDAGRPIRYAKYGEGKVSGKESIGFHGDYTLDRRARWQQMFREGWHVLGERFYDRTMHNTDWDAVYAKYAPYVDTLGTPEEFELVFSELLGELNGSHLGISMTESSYSAPGPGSGHLGIELGDGTQSLPWQGAAGLPASGEGLTVTHIVYRGPADQDGIDLAVGDTVLSIDGAPINARMRWYDLLADKAGLPVKLSVRKAAGGEPHDVVIKTVSWSQYQSLLYREWEKLNEALVDKLSGGRIGYIHIAAMSGGELDKFEREFFSEIHDKDALLVDVRFNGGGNIHEELFEHLDRRAFSWNVPRDSAWTVQPSRAFMKPKALLINARSFSDAEIFPSGWRTLGLGPVVGVPTGGAVIGTSGFTLVDGTSVRLPLEGWYELNGRNLETECTPPDVLVVQDPNALRRGEDAQLAKAVELLLQALTDAPPAPGLPQPYPAPR